MLAALPIRLPLMFSLLTISQVLLHILSFLKINTLTRTTHLNYVYWLHTLYI